MVFDIPEHQLMAAQPGEIIFVQGERYRVRKKTNKAIAVDRYYWYDIAFDHFIDFLGRLLS